MTTHFKKMYDHLTLNSQHFLEIFNEAKAKLKNFY